MLTFLYGRRQPLINSSPPGIYVCGNPFESPISDRTRNFKCQQHDFHKRFQCCTIPCSMFIRETAYRALISSNPVSHQWLVIADIGFIMDSLKHFFLVWRGRSRVFLFIRKKIFLIICPGEGEGEGEGDECRHIWYRFCSSSPSHLHSAIRDSITEINIFMLFPCGCCCSVARLLN